MRSILRIADRKRLIGLIAVGSAYAPTWLLLPIAAVLRRYVPLR